MSDGSQIEWTDATWNPVTGCTKVSPGCAHCYIERTPAFRINHRRFESQPKREPREIIVPAGDITEAFQYGPRREMATDLRLHEDRLNQPYGWKKPRRIFVNSLSDLFHEDIPDTFLARIWMTMANTPWHTYQILTKRPERMRAWAKRWADLAGESNEPQLVRGPEATRAAHPSGRGQIFADYLEGLGTPPPGAAYPTFDWMEGPRWWWPEYLPNVWLGVTAENQRWADERIPILLDTPAEVRFVSVEPMLGPVDLTDIRWPAARPRFPETDDLSDARTVLRVVGGTKLDWVIVGGESGPKHRPFKVEWGRSVVKQCAAAGVACFVKQLGGARPGNRLEDLPPDLQVREFPR
jgi:protein gp37